MAKRVFISYRRDDTASATGRVYDRLSRVLSKRYLFFDVTTIRGGEDFKIKIASEMARSDAALIFIGDNWLGPVQPTTGKTRIWDDNDLVRAEVRAALGRPILVLPILVAGAQMPKLGQLPEDVRAIRTKNAVSLRHESFDDDTENIVAAVFGVSARERTWEYKGTLRSKVFYTLGGAIAASTLLFTSALVHFWVLARPLAASIGAPVTMLLLIVSLIFGGWMGFAYEARKGRLR